MTILHARTDPGLLTRLRQMLGSAVRADIAVGYFFMSGFGQVADDLARLNKTRILIGRADRPTACIRQTPCGPGWTPTGPSPEVSVQQSPTKPRQA